MMIAKNIAFIIFRFFVSILAIKYLSRYAIPIIIKWLPTGKELVIFPMIIIRYLVTFLQKLFNFIVT